MCLQSGGDCCPLGSNSVKDAIGGAYSPVKCIIAVSGARNSVGCTCWVQLMGATHGRMLSAGPTVLLKCIVAVSGAHDPVGSNSWKDACGGAYGPVKCIDADSGAHGLVGSTSCKDPFGGAHGPAVGHGLMEALCEIVRQKFDDEEKPYVARASSQFHDLRAWLARR